ncbi:helix-turn-helix transcriptional regulator [Nocardiopsis trehalosi]|uniref:helix-turn-helix transcriptional regulator n=1 Tax=Nocardiopsis trehalosi TaxID=109329 RepID=UPI0008342F43|nr:YafY family protein [Nocardiopsis trehalosi]
MSGVSGRLLRLLSLMQGRRDWPGAELADRLGVSPRTLRRDVERLRELGYPVDGTTGTAGGYRLRAGAAMPPLLLDDDEAVAVAVGLRTAARGTVAGIEETSRRALAKLEQVLPARLRVRVGALHAAVVPLAGTPVAVDPELLTTVASARRDHYRLRFDYLARRGERSRREVEPYGLVCTDRYWYLVAWDTDRADWRTFRVDRMGGVPARTARFTPREPPHADLAAYVAAAMDAIAFPYTARVVLRAPAEAVADRLPTGGVLEPVGDGACVLRFGAETVDWLALSVLYIGVPFEIEEAPPELVARLRELGTHATTAAAGAPPA